MADYNIEQLKILVVDDNIHMRSMIRSILYALGVREVEDAGDGTEGFNQLQFFAADIVLVDWNMEPMDGMEFVRKIRTSDDTPNPYVSVIMLTGYTGLDHVMEARDAGVHEFLAKPVSPEQLYNRIKAVIEHERIFVKAGEFVGPDRRRRTKKNLDQPDRRKAK